MLKIMQDRDATLLYHVRMNSGPMARYWSTGHLLWKYQNFPDDLSGKSVLDVGCSDGFFSFLSEQRGARKVVGIDNEQFHINHTQSFAAIKRATQSKCVYSKMSVFDLDQVREQFDVTLFFDVYYHLDDPLLALKRIREITKEYVILCGAHLDNEQHLHDPQGAPVMYCLDPGEWYSHDPTNVWLASRSCLVKMLKISGFETVEEIASTPCRTLLKAH